MPKPPSKLVIGVWQGPCDDAHPDANFAAAADVIQRASSAGCAFVCLPETFLTGYGSRRIVEGNAITLRDPRLLDLARRAADRRVVALLGLAERRGRRILNSQAILDGGKVAGVYCKTIPTGPEFEMGFASDDELPVFRARGVCFGIQICHDSSFPEIASTLSWKGAQVLFSPHYNKISRGQMDEHRLRVRCNHIGIAAHFALVVARSNIVWQGGDGLLGYGDSAIFSPLGTPLAEAGLFTETLAVADVAPYLKPCQWRRREELRPALIHAWHRAALRALKKSPKRP